MPPPTANEIKNQLAALLTPIIGTSGTRKTKIIAQLAFAFKEGEDPSNLRSELDVVPLLEGVGTIQRVNCLMISEEAFTQSASVRDPTRTLTIGSKATISRRFRLTHFYQMGEGSENTASEIVELVRASVNDAPKLGFANVVDYKAGPAQFIDGHDRIQLLDFAPDAFGAVLVHVADMRLTVRVIDPQGS